MQEMENLLMMVGDRNEEVFDLKTKLEREHRRSRDPLHLDLESGALSAYGAPKARQLRSRSQNQSIKDRLHGEISGMRLTKNLKEQEKIISRVRQNFNEGRVTREEMAAQSSRSEEISGFLYSLFYSDDSEETEEQEQSSHSRGCNTGPEGLSQMFQ